MKKYMSIIAVAALSTMLLAGCENMSASEQRIGTAALGGAEVVLRGIASVAV